MRMRRLFLVAIVLTGVQLVVASSALASQPQNAPNPGSVSGGQTTAPQPTPKKTSAGNGNCSAGALILNAVNPFSHCNLGSQAVNGAGQLPGDAASLAGAAAKGLAGDVMDQVTSWMVQAAQTVDGDVMKAATSTSTPELSAPWYQQEFGYLAFFGAALAAIVALLGVFTAAVRGDPYALGEIFYGILRAAIVTAMVISLTLLALKVADGISGDVAQHMPRQFFQTLASAWGTKGWGGLASSALAFVAALVEVIVAVLLWIELLFRDAAIYVAVLFFPFTLAMAIWPRLSDAHSKLVRILGIFVAFKPAALIVMMTGSNLLLGGISFYGGVGKSVGTILAGLTVLAMAAFAPWALLHLAGLDAGVMGSSTSRRRGGRAGTDSVDGAGGTGALGGELFGGPISYAGGATASGTAIGAGRRGGAELGTAGRSGGAPSVNGGGTGDGGRRILPGPVAAAAGLLPAGWQAAQSVAIKSQSLADHGAARVHTAAGHGGAKPASYGNGNASGRAVGSAIYPRGEVVPPPPPPADDVPPPDGGGRPSGDGTGPATPSGSGDGGPNPAPAAGAEPPLPPPAPEPPFPPPREES